ncbi:hypothetical protein QR680_008257 [Steinernema hermaphroditum]|uniref:Uncharacterized protein n=1 Tax=Steinernema hermaphroditum TaxID=289476 RepID=A0AA39IHH0_9BILA|nr:hypothetical protein QR680_008257 [Steinernema hermaphroditum]
MSGSCGSRPVAPDAIRPSRVSVSSLQDVSTALGARERAEDNLFQHCDCNLCKADRCEPEPITVWSSENHCGNKFQKLGRRTIPESFGPSERRPPDPSDDKPIVFERCIGINMRFVVQRVEKTWEELKQYKDWNELFGIVKDDFIPEKPAGWNELLEEMRAEQRLLPEQKPFDFQKPPGWEQNLRAAERRSDEERVKTEQEYTTMAACFRKLIVDAHVAELNRTRIGDVTVMRITKSSLADADRIITRGWDPVRPQVQYVAEEPRWQRRRRNRRR